MLIVDSCVTVAGPFSFTNNTNDSTIYLDMLEILHCLVL